jgi:hypothetical protein
MGQDHTVPWPDQMGNGSVGFTYLWLTIRERGKLAVDPSSKPIQPQMVDLYNTIDCRVGVAGDLVATIHAF